MTDNSSPIDFRAGFNSAMAANQKVWAHDRSQTVGASEAASCWRQNYFKKRKPELADEAEEVDPEWGHTERGNLIENEFVVPTLKHMFGEDRCLFMGAEQQTFVDGRLSATPDGVVVDLPFNALENYDIPNIEGSDIATEVKSFGGDHAAPRKRKEGDKVFYEARPKHVAQNIVQMGILQRKTNYQPKVGVVLYVNPVNLKDIRVATVRYDDKVYQHLKARAEAVFEPDKEAKDFPAEGQLTGDCKYCDFCNACSAVEIARNPNANVPTDKFDPATQQRLRELTATVATLRKEEKERDKAKKAVENELKNLLMELGTNRASGDGWSTNLVQYKGRKSLDKERLVEDFDIDIEDYMIEGNPYYVLQAKADKGD